MMDLDEMLELNKFLVGQIRHTRMLQSEKIKKVLFAGTHVQFENNDGVVVQGKVLKVMRKFAQVSVETAAGQMSQTWRVPMTHLTKMS